MKLHKEKKCVVKIVTKEKKIFGYLSKLGRHRTS